MMVRGLFNSKAHGKMYGLVKKMKYWELLMSSSENGLEVSCLFQIKGHVDLKQFPNK